MAKLQKLFHITKRFYIFFRKFSAPYGKTFRTGRKKFSLPTEKMLDAHLLPSTCSLTIFVNYLEPYLR